MARGANDPSSFNLQCFFVSLQADYAFVLIQRYLQIQVSNKRHDRIFVNLHEVETVRSTMSQLRQNTLTGAVKEQGKQFLVTIELNEITWSNHDHKRSEAPEEWERFNIGCFMMCCSRSMPELFNLQFLFPLQGVFKPVIYVSVIANVMHVAINALLIDGVGLVFQYVYILDRSNPYFKDNQPTS